MAYSHKAFDVPKSGKSSRCLHEFGLTLPSANHDRVLLGVVHRQYFVTVLVGVVADLFLRLILQVHVSSKCLYQGVTSHTVVYGAV